MFRYLVRAENKCSDPLLRKCAPALAAFLLLAGSLFAGNYSIPAGRTPPKGWFPAGLDVIGGFPTAYLHTNIVAGLNSSGTNNAIRIQNALNAAGVNTLVLITNLGQVLVDAGGLKDPFNNAGHLYFYNKTNVTLRGSGTLSAPWLPNINPAATQLIMTNGSGIYFCGGRKDSSWYPGIQLGIGVTSGYTQGSTSLTLSNVTGLAAGNLICVYANKDANDVDDRGDTWLGEDSGPDPHVWAQYTIITNISGNTITVDPPIYQTTTSPSGVRVRRQDCWVKYCGLENLRIKGDTTQQYLVYMGFCNYCWVKDCETYGGGTVSAGSPHIWEEFGYANEFFHNYLHYGPQHDSGENYGIEFYHWNSRHLVLNNIVREIRHAIIFEGGGNGCVIGYNLSDDNWESVQGTPGAIDNSILSETLTCNHGAHPFMNLWEGNSTENFEGDYTQGSSSYMTLFRNSIRGYRTSYPLSSPWFWNLIEIQNYNRNYNIVGNILGSPGMSGRPGWNGGTVFNNNSGGGLPNVYRFGTTGDGGSYADTKSFSTALFQGNYDFVTNRIDALADASNTNYVNSLYYTNGIAPSWWPASFAWPPYDSARVTSAQLDATNLPAGYLFVFGTNPPTGALSGQLPSISLIDPADGAEFTNSAAINLVANVTANGHAISMVQFYNGSVLLGQTTGTNYSLNWTNVPSGGYTLMAAAVYDTNSTIDSTPVNITVTGTAGVNTTAGLLPPTQLRASQF